MSAPDIDIDTALADARTALFDAECDAALAYARSRARMGATRDTINAELAEHLPALEAWRKQGIDRLERLADDAREIGRRTIDTVRFSGIVMRLAFRVLRIEQETGERPRIEQIDAVMVEDRSAVWLYAYKADGDFFIVPVSISAAEAEAFDHREWKELVRPLCDAAPEHAT